jgi:hypothetical protein
MSIPLNRIVAFAGPYLSVVAGGIASWLVAKVNVVGLPALDENNLKTSIAGGLAWLLVAGLTWAGHSKWLAGHHIQMQTDAQQNTAALSVALAAQPQAAASEPHANGARNGFRADHLPGAAGLYEIHDPSTDEPLGDELLASDEEEFASPPPPANYTPADERELVS